MRKGSGRDWHELVVGTCPDCTAGFPRHPDHQCLPSRGSAVDAGQDRGGGAVEPRISQPTPLRVALDVRKTPPVKQGLCAQCVIPSCRLVATKGHRVSCGDKISSCRRQVQVENLHPQEARACLLFSCFVLPLPVATRSPSCLFVVTRFHLVEGKCKLKTCTHKKPGLALSFSIPFSPVPVATRFPSCLLWRQDFILSKASAS